MNPLLYWTSLILIILAILLATKKHSQLALLLLITTELLFIYLNILEKDIVSIIFWMIAILANVQILCNS